MKQVGLKAYAAYSFPFTADSRIDRQTVALENEDPEDRRGLQRGDRFGFVRGRWTPFAMAS